MNQKDNCKEYRLYSMQLGKQGLIDLDNKKEYWGNVLIKDNYLDILYTIYKPNMTFLDLGCGAGNVLKYANNIGYNVTGVEFNKNLIVYLKDYNYINEDITKLDEKFFNQFDVIYSYRPLKKEFKNFIDKVIKNMKQDSYLLTPTFIVDNDNVKDLDNYLYQKI